jgi:1,4-dihydroxy-2-naphthoyl-CoA synthase
MLFLDFRLRCLASRWSPKIREKSPEIIFFLKEYFTMIRDGMCLIEKKKVSSQDMCLYYVQNYF